MSPINVGIRFNWITLAGMILLLCCTGCASTNYQFRSETLDYKSRAEKRSDGSVMVSASALSVDEGRDIYGITLARKNIQAVWIEVENGEEDAYWLLSPGVDPNFLGWCCSRLVIFEIDRKY